MNKTLDALLNEMNEDILAKLALAAASGVIAVASGKKLYKKYKEHQLLKKYGAQEDKADKRQTLKDELRDDVPEWNDIRTSYNFIDPKKRLNEVASSDPFPNSLANRISGPISTPPIQTGKPSKSVGQTVAEIAGQKADIAKPMNPSKLGIKPFKRIIT